MDDDVLLEFASDNAGVLGVESSVDDRSFVLFGVGPGATSISISISISMEIDHLERAEIPVTVKLQPAP